MAVQKPRLLSEANHRVFLGRLLFRRLNTLIVYKVGHFPNQVTHHRYGCPLLERMFNVQLAIVALSQTEAAWYCLQSSWVFPLLSHP